MKTIVISIFALVLSATGFQSAYAQTPATEQKHVQTVQVDQEKLNAAEATRVEAAKQAEVLAHQAELMEKEAYIQKLEKNKAAAVTSEKGSSVDPELNKPKTQK